MVCSACGYENQVGNRFCGMCGIPLPHRPLTAPGAQGTHSLMRMPMEAANPAERQPTAAKSGGTTAPSPTVVPIETPSTESRSRESSQPENFSPSMPDMVTEVSLDEYVRNFRYIPPADPEEITTRGDAQVSQPEAPAGSDPPAPNGIVGAANMIETLPAGPIEDVGERLGLEDLPDVDERHDRPRFLDFSEPAPPPAEPPAPEATTAMPSFLELSDSSQVIGEVPEEAETRKSSGMGWLTWVAVAVLVLAGVGAFEWRAQVNHTGNGPLEVAKMQLQKIRRSYNAAAPSSSYSDNSVSKQEMQAAGQTAQPAQDQNTAANPNAPNSTTTNTPQAASDATSRTNAASPPQNTTAASALNPQPAGQKTTATTPSFSLNEVQSATGQKAAQPKPTPLATTSEVVTAAETPNARSTAAERPKPKPPSAQEDESSVTTKKAVPGEDELIKANNASDSAAAAAWLWKATAKGNPDAPLRLAEMYVKGDGVPRSCEQALVLLKTAAAKENARPRNRLAAMYNSGTCVQRNRVEAYRWLSSALAADPNSHWAQETRQLIWQQMTADERAAAQRYR